MHIFATLQNITTDSFCNFSSIISSHSILMQKLSDRSREPAMILPNITDMILTHEFLKFFTLFPIERDDFVPSNVDVLSTQNQKYQLLQPKFPSKSR